MSGASPVIASIEKLTEFGREYGIICEKGHESVKRPFWFLFADSVKSDHEKCSFSQICEKGSVKRAPSQPRVQF